MSALAGRRVVITRALHQSPAFERLLRERGATALLYPCIDIAPPPDLTPLDDALLTAADGAFDWLLLTSANTVSALAQRMSALNLRPSALAGLRVAAVGPVTAKAASQMLGLYAHIAHDEYMAEALAGAIQPVVGARVLLPQSATAERALAEVLASLGANVTVVEAYRTVMGNGGVDLLALLRAGEVDAVTFTSASTVVNLLQRLENEGGEQSLLAGVCVACIGEKTASAAQELGLTVSIVSDVHTLEGLTAALERYFGC